MSAITVISYGASALSFLFLSLLLVTSWRGRLQGGLLVSAGLATTLWAALVALNAWYGPPLLGVVHLSEVLRDVLWLIFLLRLMHRSEATPWYRGRLGRWLMAVVASASMVVLIFLYQAVTGRPLPPALGVDASILGYVMLAVIGLVLVENLFRNTHPEHRWAIKYLCFGLGGMFAYDFYLYADTLLFKDIDSASWAARGAVNFFMVPLIAIAAARNPQWSLDVFVSRGMVFHSVALMGAGLYLLAMAAGGYYIRFYGGTWGAVAQMVFLFGAGVVLVMMLFSGQLRARLRVLLNKHFFSYKYDYREEWQRFIRTLYSGEIDRRQREHAIQAIAEIVDSAGGILWLRQDNGTFEHMAVLNTSSRHLERIPAADPLVDFLRRTGWVIDLNEYRSVPEAYQGLTIPTWLDAMADAWLVVPLVQHHQLLGLVVLVHAKAPRELNWEDNDFLKSAGQQAAGYLAQIEATQALVNARQFEAFNKLSAYVVHDLKNLIAQLSLVVANAPKFKHDARFVDDMIATVANSVDKMNQLMAQLRSQKVKTSRDVVIDLGELLGQVVSANSDDRPRPNLKVEMTGLKVKAERERLAAILSHLVQNAQDATAEDGSIDIRLRQHAGKALIEIQDTGCGMDERFVRERLFRPFDTTKGHAGMGIGAYESREFIQGLGGEVDVESRPGIGTTFRIHLPLSPSS